MQRGRSTRAVAALLAATLWAMVAVASVSAQGIPKDVHDQIGAAAGGAGVGQQEAKIEVVVARIINVSLSLLGIILVALLVYAGWLWMTAAGEEEQITKAKSIIRSAIIGLIIVLAAYAISRFVITRLTAATSSNARL